MNYTYQTISESGSFSDPSGTDVHHAANLAFLKWDLSNWIDSHDRVGASPSDACLMVWKGRHSDITDVYPDFILRRGSRGGVVKELC